MCDKRNVQLDDKLKSTKEVPGCFVKAPSTCCAGNSFGIHSVLFRLKDDKFGNDDTSSNLKC